MACVGNHCEVVSKEAALTFTLYVTTTKRTAVPFCDPPICWSGGSLATEYHYVMLVVAYITHGIVTTLRSPEADRSLPWSLVTSTANSGRMHQTGSLPNRPLLSCP